MQAFWEKVSRYSPLSEESRQAWEQILKERTYKKNELFVAEGQIPRTVAFVHKGLFSQYYTSGEGDIVIKRFFPENFFVASLTGLLQESPSIFTIRALETSHVLEYSFREFKRL